MSEKEDKLKLLLGQRITILLTEMATDNLQAQKNAYANVLSIVDEVKADFPYKIYRDNNGIGENEEPTFSFYIKNPADPDKSFPVEDLLEVERQIAIWHNKWFGKPTNL